MSTKRVRNVGAWFRVLSASYTSEGAIMAESELHICTVEIRATHIASAYVTLAPRKKPQVEAYDLRDSEAEAGGAVLLHNALAAARRVCELAGSALDGIGVASAGVVDPKTGDITYASHRMPGWAHTHLADEFSQSLGLECRVMNRVSAYALGEARAGAGRSSESCLVVVAGSGIGGAYVNHGAMLLGAHNGAGNIGHATCSDAEGELCACGCEGHVETIAAAPGIKQRFCELGGKRFVHEGETLDLALIDRLANAGNAAAQAAETRSGHALGEVLGSMCNMLDPETLILTGPLSELGPHWHDPLMRGWAQTAMPLVKNIPIRSGELGAHAPLVGAAEQFLASAYL